MESMTSDEQKLFRRIHYIRVKAEQLQIPFQGIHELGHGGFGVVERVYSRQNIFHLDNVRLALPAEETLHLS